MTDRDVTDLLNATQVVACTLYGEGRGCSKEGRHAIASVIGNRSRLKGFGVGLKGVCLKDWQFSCWKPEGGEINHAAVMNAARSLYREDPVMGPVMQHCMALAIALKGGLLVDSVHRATHYYAPAGMVPKGSVPKWSVGLEPVARIDGHLFFADVP